MNLTTQSGLPLTVDDLEYFNGSEGVVCQGWTRLVVAGRIAFTDWCEAYESIPPLMWLEIEAALNEAAADMRRSDVIEHAYRCQLAEEFGIHGA